VVDASVRADDAAHGGGRIEEPGVDAHGAAARHDRGARRLRLGRVHREKGEEGLTGRGGEGGEGLTGRGGAGGN
jgi:hypothetical protein